MKVSWKVGNIACKLTVISNHHHNYHNHCIISFYDSHKQQIRASINKPQSHSVTSWNENFLIITVSFMLNIVRTGKENIYQHQIIACLKNSALDSALCHGRTQFFTFWYFKWIKPCKVNIISMIRLMWTQQTLKKMPLIDLVNSLMWVD